MKKTYSLAELENELDRSAAVLEYERQYAKMLTSCHAYGLTPHPLWLSDTGRFTLAAIVAATLSGDTEGMRNLQRQWEAWAETQPGE